MIEYLYHWYHTQESPYIIYLGRDIGMIEKEAFDNLIVGIWIMSILVIVISTITSKVEIFMEGATIMTFALLLTIGVKMQEEEGVVFNNRC